MSDSSWAYLSAHGYDASACPKCGGKTGVLHTAREKRGYLIRPRECKNCGELYYTAELIVGWEKNENPRKPRQRTVCTGEPDNSSSQPQALEPRALTIDEVIALKEGEVVWCEEQGCITPMVSCGSGQVGNFYVGYEVRSYYADYMTFWSARPTAEQRKAVKRDE